MIKVKSFSYKHGPIPDTMHRVDVRTLRNPHNVMQLRDLDGRNPLVQEYVMHSPGFEAIMATAIKQIELGETLAFGCYGGRHRSVACAEIAARYIRETGLPVEVEHTALQDA